MNTDNTQSITVSAQWNLVDYVKNFNYTGSVQTFTAPETGYYKLEVWGAQGGNAIKTNYGTYRGGYGSYSVGILNLTAKNTVLYIYVGGKGTDDTDGGTEAGGYNGGGQSKSGTGDSYASGSGGGATHIAKVSGLLKDLSSYRNTGGTNISNEILIVAGGGGGGSYHVDSPSNAGYNRCARDPGGNAGGMNGVNGSGGSCHSGWTGWTYGVGGTQTAGGIPGQYANIQPGYAESGNFGLGGSGGANSGGGGGSGWYGGSGGHGGSGGGGSGYIGSSNLLSGAGITKHMTCYSCSTSTTTATRTNSNTTTPATTPTADVARTGNGYARITWVGDTI